MPQCESLDRDHEVIGDKASIKHNVKLVVNCSYPLQEICERCTQKRKLTVLINLTSQIIGHITFTYEQETGFA